MSRIAKAPIKIPEGVNIKQEGNLLSVKGKLGEMTMHVNSSVQISTAENVLTFAPKDVDKKEEKH
jgi:large subunit ribosomal protein L6